MHAKIDAQPSSNFFFQPRASDLDICDGNLESWVKNLFSENGTARNPSPCNQSGCSCDQDAATIYLSIPAVLIIEFGYGDWSVPSIISISADTTYELVGRTLFDAKMSHYTTLFIWTSDKRPAKIIRYDDLVLDGHAQELPGAGFRARISGKDHDLLNISKGYHTQHVVYRLRNGLDTQESFCTDRLAKLRKQHDIVIHTQGVSSLLSSEIRIQRPNLVETSSSSKFSRAYAMQPDMLPAQDASDIEGNHSVNKTRDKGKQSEKVSAKPVCKDAIYIHLSVRRYGR
jgi:hypothetical protein